MNCPACGTENRPDRHPRRARGGQGRSRFELAAKLDDGAKTTHIGWFLHHRWLAKVGPWHGTGTCWSTSSACAGRWTSSSADVWGAGGPLVATPPDRLLSPRRRLLLRRATEGHRQGRSRRREPRQHRPRGGGPRARDQRRAAHSGDRGPCVPAGRDRGRAVPARHRARTPTWSPRRPGPPTRTGSSASSCRCGRAPPPAAACRSRPASSCGATRWGHPRAGRGGGRRPEHRGRGGRRHRAGHSRAPGPAVPGALPVLPLQEMVPYPGHADPARGRARAFDATRQRGPLGRAHARDGRVQEPRGSRSPGPTSSTTSASPAIVARMLKVPGRDHQDPGPGHRARSADRLRRRGALSRRPHRAAARTSSSRPRSWRRSPTTSSAPSRRSSSRSPTCPRSCSSRSQISTTRRRSRT